MTKQPDTEIVVSMTTYPARIGIAHQALQSILDQTVRPDRIVLCLAREEFPEGVPSLPGTVRNLLDEGVELLWAERNLKPHKKYFYTMRKYPDSVVITVDDDKIYAPTLVAELMESYRRFPRCVSAMHVHLMAFGKNGELLPYAQWGKLCRAFVDHPNLALFAVGDGGVLYPPHLLSGRLFDEDGILSTTLNGDDIWLKIMEVANGIPVVLPSAKSPNPMTVEGSQAHSLFAENKLGNDEMIRQALEYYRRVFGESAVEIIRTRREAPTRDELDILLRRMAELQEKYASKRTYELKALSDSFTVRARCRNGGDLERELEELAIALNLQRRRADKAVRNYEKARVRLASANVKLSDCKLALKKMKKRYRHLAGSKLGRVALAYWWFRDRLGRLLRGQPTRGKSPLSVKRRKFRVLFPCRSGNMDGKNPFVGTLCEALGRLGVRCECGVHRLFDPSRHYDIVNVMWPEAIWKWRQDDVTDEFVLKLALRFAELKSNGTKIVYTRHNTAPHVSTNPLTKKVYELVEECADVVIHLGDWSRRNFLECHQSSMAGQFVIPHHTYTRALRNISKSDARTFLGLSLSDRVLLSFGAFRNEQERRLLALATRKCKVKGLKTLAPRFGANPPADILADPQGVCVPSDLVSVYFAAADVVFIQRTEILNSGNLPMAYHFGRVCVGPDCGNVGELLRNTGNFVFDPADEGSVVTAVCEALAASQDGELGKRNRELADREWGQDLVARKILEVYRQKDQYDVPVPERFLQQGRH